MTVLPACYQATLSGSTWVPLVSHFRFSISLRKIRKNEKLKFQLQKKTYSIRLVLSIRAYIWVLIFSLFYLINTVGILFLCLHLLTSSGSRSLTDFSCLWILSIIGLNHNLILSQRTTVFSLGFHLPYSKAILVGVQKQCKLVYDFPQHPWRAYALPCTTISKAPAWRSVFMSCVMMYGKPWYNSVYDMLIN